MFDTKSATSALQKYIFYLYRYMWWAHGWTPGKRNLPVRLISAKAFNSLLTSAILQFRKQNVPSPTGRGCLEHNTITVTVISLVGTGRPVVKYTLLRSGFQSNTSLSIYTDSPNFGFPLLKGYCSQIMEI